MSFLLPINEMFVSPQGEGVHTGKSMQFIRLAGCTVGKPIKAVHPTSEKAKSNGYKDTVEYGTIPVFQEECTLYDGRKFLCDTDFRAKEKLSVLDVYTRIDKTRKHICITGGEPFMHEELSELCYMLWKADHTVHIETSGTIPMTKIFAKRMFQDDLWITVSPKFNVLPSMIERANEIKLLIDKNFDVSKVPESVLKHECVFIQPVNGINEISEENARHCVELQNTFPTWVISVQQHKVLGVR